MKQIYLALLLFTCLLLSAQHESPITYSGVIEVPVVSKDSLFIKARQWLTETFTTAWFYPYTEDRETCELAGRANTWLAIRESPASLSSMIVSK